jgi:uncharacterized protein
VSQSIYEVTVPTLLRAFDNLAVILDKGRAHAEQEKIEPSVLLNMRLFPNMFPLTRQVQIASDTAKGALARLAAVEPPKFEDNETSFAELLTRVEKTQTFVRSFKAAQLEASETRPVVLKFPSRTLNFKNGWDYLLTFVFPNVYFHTATAYDILRHGGVPVGKGDFLGAVGNS